jgi:hypothetical protein
MANYPTITKAIDAAIIDAKLSLFNNLRKALLDELDEDSIEAIGSLFDKFKESNPDEFKAPKAPTKKGKKAAAAADANPDKKKRGPSAYNLFARMKMKELMEEDKELKSKEAMSKAAGMWKELSADEKQAFKDKLAADAAAAPVPEPDAE